MPVVTCYFRFRGSEHLIPDWLRLHTLKGIRHATTFIGTMDP